MPPYAPVRGCKSRSGFFAVIVSIAAWGFPAAAVVPASSQSTDNDRRASGYRDACDFGPRHRPAIASAAHPSPTNPPAPPRWANPVSRAPREARAAVPSLIAAGSGETAANHRSEPGHAGCRDLQAEKPPADPRWVWLQMCPGHEPPALERETPGQTRPVATNHSRRPRSTHCRAADPQANGRMLATSATA